MEPPNMMRRRSEGDERPHLDAIVHPEMRAVPQLLITPEMLDQRRQNLRPTSRSSQNSEVDEKATSVSGESFKRDVTASTGAYPRPRRTGSKPRQVRRSEQMPGRWEIESDDITHRGEAEIERKDESEELKQREWTAKESDFEEALMTNPRVQSWIAQLIAQAGSPQKEQFSQTGSSSKRRISQVESPKGERLEERRLKEMNRRNREFDEISGKGKEKEWDSISVQSGRKSILSTVSKRSLTKSMKNVLFHISGAEEVRSQTGSDDVVTVSNVGSDKAGRICERFTIHGPYVDDELNVFHEFCREYLKAAEVTFAKRSILSRTRPAHERVYGLLGSDKRTKWTNQRDWVAVTNDLKLLDHLFRSTIRSKTLKIKEPGLELEGFEKGKTLDYVRFRRIVKHAFTRRDQLKLTIVGAEKAFDSIV
jgi:hypothetical protein